MIDVDEDRLAQARRDNRARRARLCAELKSRLGNPQEGETRESGGGPSVDFTEGKTRQLQRDIADCDDCDAQLHDALLRAQSQ